MPLRRDFSLEIKTGHINPDGSITERGKRVIQNTPMGRFGKADELIGAILFLASDAASFVTGVILPIDGGFSFYSGVKNLKLC